MAMDGKNILVLAESAPDTFAAVAEQTGLSWESTTNMIEASSKDDGHTKWIAGKKDDTLSLEAAYVPGDDAYKSLKAAQANGELVVLRRSESGLEVEEAAAYVTSISGDAPDNDRATVSIEFQLNESWTEITTP